MYKDGKKMQLTAHIVMILLSVLALMPFVLLVICSFTEEQYAIRYGYSFFPKAWSLEAYKYLLTEGTKIGRAYVMTILVTVIGTVGSVLINTSLAYGLSRDVLGKRIINLYIVLTMLFSGGMVASYYVWSNIFNIKNTLWALILPNYLVSGFNIILVRNYFSTNIPKSLFESAELDGASDFYIFKKIVLPLSKPILATIGMMAALLYWNDWNNGLYFVDDSNLYTIQLLLNKINENATFLANSNMDLIGKGGVSSIPSTTVRMAIAVVGIIPIIIAYPFFQKYFIKGITVGAVKE